MMDDTPPDSPADNPQILYIITDLWHYKHDVIPKLKTWQLLFDQYRIFIDENVTEAIHKQIEQNVANMDEKIMPGTVKILRSLDGQYPPEFPAPCEEDRSPTSCNPASRYLSRQAT